MPRSTWWPTGTASPPSLPCRRGLALGIRVLGGAPGADPGTAVREAARLELVELAQAGKLDVRVEAAYPLTEVAKAHRRLAKGHAHGKIVLVP